MHHTIIKLISKQQSFYIYYTNNSSNILTWKLFIKLKYTFKKLKFYQKNPIAYLKIGVWLPQVGAGMYTTLLGSYHFD